MNKKEIGKLIKRVRKSSGTKPLDLFKKHGVTSEQLKAIENGSKKYTIDTLINVCEFYGVEVSIKIPISTYA